MSTMCTRNTTIYRSPESVLFESEQLELSYYDELSPEIVPELQRRKLDLNSPDKNNEENIVGIQKEEELIKVKHENEIQTQKTNIFREPGRCNTVNPDAHFLDEFRSTIFDCESVREFENKYFEKWNKEEQDTKFKIISEKTSQNSETDKIKQYRPVENNRASIRSRSTTPCSDSPPPAKRCRTILKFDDEEEVQQSQKPLVSTVMIDFVLKEKKNIQNIFYPSTIITKTPWSTCTSESPSTSNLDLPLVSDSGNCSRNLLEQERVFSHACICYKSQKKFKSPFRLSKKPIMKVFVFCIWLMKKLGNMLKKTYKNYKKVMIRRSTKEYKLEELNQTVIMLRSDNQQMINVLLEKVNHLSEKITQVRADHVTTLDALTAEVNNMQEINRKLTEANETLEQELKKLQKMLQNIQIKSPKIPCPPQPPPLPPPMPPMLSIPPPPPPLPPPFFHSPAQITPTTPKRDRNVRTPTRKCSTPLLNRPAITVEDLLKVTLKKAPQNVKENRRNTIPGPRGPIVSLDMLRSVKLKSARRRTYDQITKSPKSARIIKTRTASRLSLSPIMMGTDNSLERILKQVDVRKHEPRRLLSSMTNSRESSIMKDNQPQNTNGRDSDSQSVIV